MPDKHELVLQRTVGTTAQQLFDTLTAIEGLKTWFSPGNCHLEEGTITPEEGGTYSLRMFTGESGIVSLTGTYDRVVPNNELAFSWTWGEPLGGSESHVTMSLAPAKRGTELRIEHTGFSCEEERDHQIEGWRGSLAKLRDLYPLPEEGDSDGNVDKTPGKFSWHELLTHDVEQAKAYYAALFGWTSTTVPMEGAEYHMFRLDGEPVAGMMQIQPEWGPVPPNWMSYATVDNVEAAVERVQKNGGNVLQPAKEIPGMGRLAVVQDPGGAVLSFWEFSCY